MKKYTLGVATCQATKLHQQKHCSCVVFLMLLLNFMLFKINQLTKMTILYPALGDMIQKKNNDFEARSVDTTKTQMSITWFFLSQALYQRVCPQKFFLTMLLLMLFVVLRSCVRALVFEHWPDNIHFYKICFRLKENPEKLKSED